MKIVLICNSSSNQRALAYKLSKKIGSFSIVVQEHSARTPKLRRGDLRFLNPLRISRMLTNFPFRQAWLNMLRKYEFEYPNFPFEPVLEIEDLADSKLLNLLEDKQPNLVLVSGTSLLKEPLINKIKEYGHVMNLHTGISPYLKGGPNCTNWCLRLKRFDLIGNTVMWINAGIDSGDLITTERTPLHGKESLVELHLEVMEHAHELYIKAVNYFVAGNEIEGVSQSSLPSHRLYLTKDWDLSSQIRALINFQFFYNQKRMNQLLSKAT